MMAGSATRGRRRSTQVAPLSTSAAPSLPAGHEAVVADATSPAAAPAAARRTWPRPRLLVALVVVVVAATVAAGYLRLGPRRPVMLVERMPIVQTVVASGRVVTPNRVQIGSQLTGTVAEVPVEEGDPVEAGRLLVRLQDAEALAGVKQAESALAQADARLRQLREVQLPVAEQSLAQASVTLENARRQLERNQELRERGFIGQAQLDDARKAADLAHAQWLAASRQASSVRPSGPDTVLARLALENAQAALEAARARLAYTRIVAPVDGRIIDRQVERGDIVQPGKVLMRLAPAGATQLVVQIDERNLSLLALGQPALASADAFPRERFAARLAFVNPAVDPQRGAVETRLDVLERPAYLREDMTVSVDIEVARRDSALVLPLDAVRGAETDRPTVAVIANGHVSLRPVRLGLRGGGKVEIVEGLAEGDEALPAHVAVSDGRRMRGAPASAAR